MRALHLATSRRGGAAIAASRIVAAQESAGLQAEIAYRNQPDRRTDHVHGGLTISPSSTRMAVGRAATLANRLITRPPSVLFTPAEVSVQPELLRAYVGEGDILNAHNIYNFASVRVLTRVSPTMPIVFTLHDERLFTAGCHYTLACELYESNCSPCPQSKVPPLVRRRPIWAHNHSWVVPSEWLRAQALRSGLDPHRVVHIPNPIDTSVFNVERRPLTRSEDVFTLALLPGKGETVAWEGVRIAQAALAAELPRVTLRVITTHSASSVSGVTIERVDDMQSEASRADFWAQADASISITIADNFPNIALESIAVGTPLLVSDVGGAAEAVRATGGGIPLEGDSPGAIAEGIVSMATRQQEWRARSTGALKKCHELYNYQRIGRMYEQHYLSELQRLA